MRKRARASTGVRAAAAGRSARSVTSVPHERHERPHRAEGGRPPRHGHGKPRFEERRERPERQPDPNSPFAKLAALKAQLESGGKEP
ncbi:MAG: hypothetical protein M5U33_12640 [Pseudorhodoplanes sp.]|nr:hypothetical protein [Pseudorhodoplanes sp.]